MKYIKGLLVAFILIAGINLGLAALFNVDLIGKLGYTVANIFYIIVGVSSVAAAIMIIVNKGCMCISCNCGSNSKKSAPAARPAVVAAKKPAAKKTKKKVSKKK